MSSIFIGRKREMERLVALHNKRSSALAVINGRRRIGKSRLVAEFAEKCVGCKSWSFAGLAPLSKTCSNLTISG